MARVQRGRLWSNRNAVALYSLDTQCISKYLVSTTGLAIRNSAVISGGLGGNPEVYAFGDLTELQVRPQAYIDPWGQCRTLSESYPELDLRDALYVGPIQYFETVSLEYK